MCAQCHVILEGGRKANGLMVPIQTTKDYESQQANQLLNQKYGLRGKMLGIMYKLRKIEFVVLSIHFSADETSRR